jgi:hypothetical protein
MASQFPIHIWINDERYEELKQTGLAAASKDVLAGMRVISVLCSAAQKDELLKRYPSAKYDSATTRSIELLPRQVKDRLFELIIQLRSTEVIDAFLSNP